MCLILWLQTNFKPGCNHLWCRTHELGRINPTPFVTFSTWRLLLEMASVGCSETFHSSEQGPGTPVTWHCTVLYTGNSSFAGKQNLQKNSFLPKQHSDAFAVPCCSASLCCWESLRDWERAGQRSSSRCQGGVGGEATFQNGARPPQWWSF